jgi:voltage-gated potassium channel
MKNHIIICGYGYHGRRIAEALEKEKIPHVIIDLTAEDEKENLIKGDAKDEENLLKAGIKEAKEIVIAVSNDIDAVFISLLARNLNPDIRIVAKADRLDSMKKIYMAGANKVISPYVIGGRLLARAVAKPLVAEFFKRVTIAKDLEVAQVAIGAESKFAGKKIRDMDLASRGLAILAVYRAGELIPNPPADFLVEEGDHLIILGSNEEIMKLRSREKLLG